MKKVKQVVTDVDWEKLEKQYLMGLTRSQAAKLYMIVVEDAKSLASRYCMSLLPSPEKLGFSEDCIAYFSSILKVPTIEFPPEEFFDLMCGPGKWYDIKQSERRVIFCSERQRKMFSKFYCKNMFRKFIEWVLEFRKYGVYNWAHYDVYNLIAKFGFPVMHKLNTNA